MLRFLASQRSARRGSAVVGLADGEAGLAARTIARRLSSVRGLFDYPVVHGDAGLRVKLAPHGLSARQPSNARGRPGVPLIRSPRTLPRVVSPSDVEPLLVAFAHATRSSDG